jgi:hypothetical protein
LCAMRGLVFGDRRRREDLKPGYLMPVRGHNEDNPVAPKYGGKLTSSAAIPAAARTGPPTGPSSTPPLASSPARLPSRPPRRPQ